MDDEELVDFAKDFRSGILGDRMPTLACFMVCFPLVGLLKASNVVVELVDSDLGWINHFWIRLGDGRALDPTADQFNYLDNANFPPVYLGKRTKYHISK